jgi:dihydropteroate synthase
MFRLRPQFDLTIAGRRVKLGERTLLVGVVNVTPDSFSDGGRYLEPERAVARALELTRQGADWIDVGGESTRPGSKPVPAREELRRILPVIRGLHRRKPGLVISIDTTKSDVADAALRAGASVVNDVSGLRFDPSLAEVARRHRAPLVLMHLRGRPETMQTKPFARDVWRSVRRGLARSIRTALARGLRRSQLILDPGLGFGKSRRQNYELVAGLSKLHRFGLPVLVGTSRKSFVQALAAGEGLDAARFARRSGSPWPLTRVAGVALASRRGKEPASPLAIADAAMVAATILAGAHLVRVHDVAGVLPAVRLADALLSAAREGR